MNRDNKNNQQNWTASQWEQEIVDKNFISGPGNELWNLNHVAWRNGQPIKRLIHNSNPKIKLSNSFDALFSIASLYFVMNFLTIQI